jgi:hypothetical protein
MSEHLNTIQNLGHSGRGLFVGVFQANHFWQVALNQLTTHKVAGNWEVSAVHCSTCISRNQNKVKPNNFRELPDE